ncbi:helix-turn-helix transcriptional regulator [Trichloromonas sp.]|uniref:helix-turn-helix transcriptional regulator n=1 Tax=Trichloromonas sp. TaxID=3069249 RepID=UPI003D819C30
MPKRPTRKRTPEEIRREKETLYAELGSGLLTLGQATRRMRKIVGMTQTEYAEKILKIYPRVLMEIERDRGNPTLETLEKIARPFGLKVGFVAKASHLPGTEGGEG